MTTTCSWSALVQLGAWGQPLLAHTNKIVGFPTNLASPLKSLSGSLCLEERVGLVAAGALVSGVIILAATPQIIKAINSSTKLALYATIPIAIFVAEKYFQ